VNLILFAEGELKDGALRLEGERAAHVIDVLRLTIGDRLRVGQIDGPIGTACVRSAADGVVELDALTLDETPPAQRVDLLLALPRPKVLARLLSPMAQLGVRRIFLSGAWKVERFYFDAHVLAPEVMRAHLLEGLAQVKDTRMPEVSVHRSLTFLVRDELPNLVPSETQRLVCDPRGAPIERAPRAAHTLLVFGPEGGFTAREDRLFEEHAFARVGLGERTLRSDVAVLAALARVHAR
jgi:RsmE family RNA methyltransferase